MTTSTSKESYLKYSDAIAWATNQVVEEYTINDLKQLTYNTVYDHFDNDFDSLLDYCDMRGIKIIGD